VEDLVNVQGIGFKTLDRIREFVIVGPGKATDAPASQPAASTVEQPAVQAN